MKEQDDFNQTVKIFERHFKNQTILSLCVSLIYAERNTHLCFNVKINSYTLALGNLVIYYENDNVQSTFMYHHFYQQGRKTHYDSYI